jgi:hypothetical protein
MLVFTNPIPGKDAKFNDWCTHTHMGDLVQLQGSMDAQRFRVVTNVFWEPIMPYVTKDDSVR